MREDIRLISEGLEVGLEEVLLLHPTWEGEETSIEEVKLDGQYLHILFLNGSRDGSWHHVNIHTMNNSIEVELDAEEPDLDQLLRDTVGFPGISIRLTTLNGLAGHPVIKVSGPRRLVLLFVARNWGPDMIDDIRDELFESLPR